MDVKLLYNLGDGKFRSVGEKMLEWEPALIREAGSPGPRLSSPGERERKAVITRRVEGSICCSLCSVSNSLSHTTLSIKWEVYFSKELCPLVFIVSSLCFCKYMCVYSWLWLYNDRTWYEVKWSEGRNISTTLRFRRGHYAFSWIAPVNLDPYLIMLSVKQGSIKYHFWVFAMIRPGI